MAGARQVGKATLVTDVTRPGGDHPMRSVTLDDRAAREAARDDPAGFVAGLGAPAVIDEIQHAPALLLELKQAVDADTVPGRFLITGSADVLAHRKVIDALPGRIDRIELWPLARSEIEGGTLNVIDELLAGRALRSPQQPSVLTPTRPRFLRAATRRRVYGPPGGCAIAGSVTTSPGHSARTCTSSPTFAAPTRPTGCCD